MPAHYTNRQVKVHLNCNNSLKPLQEAHIVTHGQRQPTQYTVLPTPVHYVVLPHTVCKDCGTYVDIYIACILDTLLFTQCLTSPYQQFQSQQELKQPENLAPAYKCGLFLCLCHPTLYHSKSTSSLSVQPQSTNVGSYNVYVILPGILQQNIQEQYLKGMQTLCLRCGELWLDI